MDAERNRFGTDLERACARRAIRIPDVDLHTRTTGRCGGWASSHAHSRQLEWARANATRASATRAHATRTNATSTNATRNDATRRARMPRARTRRSRAQRARTQRGLPDARSIRHRSRPSRRRCNGLSRTTSCTPTTLECRSSPKSARDSKSFHASARERSASSTPRLEKHSLLLAAARRCLAHRVQETCPRALLHREPPVRASARLRFAVERRFEAVVDSAQIQSEPRANSPSGTLQLSTVAARRHEHDPRRADRARDPDHRSDSGPQPDVRQWTSPLRAARIEQIARVGAAFGST